MKTLLDFMPFRSVRVRTSNDILAGDQPIRPLPYPDGWFAVAFSGELPARRVLSRRFMGEDIVLYRTRSGLVRAVRPYCPHLGAHFGYGGRVDGEDLVCPFHGFAFAPTGVCVRNGYGTPPPKAQLTTLDVREVDGVILVWRHSQGQSPDWEVPSTMTEEFCPEWAVTTINSYPQEIMENFFDCGHGPTVHRIIISKQQVRFAGVKAEFRAETGPIQRGRIGLIESLTIESGGLLHGLGWAHANSYFPSLRSRLRIWVLPTPVDPASIELRIAVKVERVLGIRVPHPVARLVGRVLILVFSYDISRDGRIWQNKIYVEHPKLAKGDGPIMEFRRWAKQFYSDVALTSNPAGQARR
jgi:nitrite reductase/ring-hydroxylating ferredoxin subunit